MPWEWNVPHENLSFSVILWETMLIFFLGLFQASVFDPPIKRLWCLWLMKVTLELSPRASDVTNTMRHLLGRVRMRWKAWKPPPVKIALVETGWRAQSEVEEREAKREGELEKMGQNEHRLHLVSSRDVIVIFCSVKVRGGIRGVNS